ncbi:MAG: ComF family protein [Clostridia bacterium]|nr:ComF family protein [Clostridia bacterium]
MKKAREQNTKQNKAAARAQIYKRLESIRDTVLDFFFPPLCVCCLEPMKSSVSAFCEECISGYINARRGACRHCGKEMMHCTCAPEELVRSGVYRVAKVCPYYPDRKKSPELKLIFAVKRKNLYHAERFMAREMAAAVRRMPESCDGFIVTYVPRRPESINEYGYDHAKDLSKILAKELGLCWEDVFYRPEGAKEQKGLTRKERSKNASSTILPRDNISVKGKRYIICDDVLTSGASMAACARVLKALGATELRGAVFAARG